MQAIKYNEGDVIQGFRVERVEEIAELEGVSYVMTHEVSGAQLLYLDVSDDEKGFAVAFKTLPTDNTGVFHILEHSVLCGSDKYPVKEPFVHLLKSSMNTYLNAATGPNYTIFPVASTNQKDLMNLMSVYLDAVFHPSILHDPRVFQQEAWHYETDGENLSINGVVYNEMKGAFANPGEAMARALMEELFPDTAFRFASGGTPEGIATLDYEQFIDTYKRHYRPDNSAMMLYGEMDLEAVLAMIDEAYVQACATCAQRGVGKPNQMGSQKPIVSTDRVVFAEGSPYDAQIVFASACTEPGDCTRSHALALLVSALFNIEDAPIRKRILDAGLAMEVSATAMMPGPKESVAVFAMGSKPNSKQAFLDSIREGCQELLSTGIDKRLLEAAIFAVEFRFRTGGPSGKPGASSYLYACLTDWANGLPLGIDFARYEDDIAFFRNALETGYFEQLMKEAFLDTNHYAVVELVPEADNKSTIAIAENLESLAEEMGPEGLARIKQQADDLKAFQDAPDSPEALATLPRLSRTDCGEAPQHLGSHEEQACGRTILRHDFEDRGVAHISRYYDVSSLSEEDSKYLPFLVALVSETATSRHSTQDVVLLKMGRLGALYAAAVIKEDLRDDLEGDSLHTGLLVYSCSLSSDIEFTADFVNEVLHETLFADRDKLRECIDGYYFRTKALALEFSPHKTAGMRASAHFSRAAVLADEQQGIASFQFVQELKKRCEDDAEADKVLRRLKILGARVFGTEPILYAYAGDDETLERFFAAEDRCVQAGIERATAILSELSEEELAYSSGRKIAEIEPLSGGDEAFVVPGDSAHCAAVYDASAVPFHKSGSWPIASRAASLDYLWNEVRVKGGAYGTSFSAGSDGFVVCNSFRDPDIDSTLECFDNASSWLREIEITEEDLDGYVISTVAASDRPMKGFMRFVRDMDSYLSGWRKGSKARRRDEMLATQLEDIHHIGDELAKCVDKRCVVVLASRDKIEKSNHAFTVVDLVDDSLQ